MLAGLAGLAVMAGSSQPAWAQTDADTNYFLTGNYFSVLGRYPDSAGWIWNKAALAGGLARTDFTNNFFNGTEYLSEWGSSPDSNTFITDLYNDALLRPPAGGDVSAWQNLMVPIGSLTRAQVVNQFIYATEFAGNANGAVASSYRSAWTIPASVTWSGNSLPNSPQTVTFYFANAYGAADIAYGQILVNAGTGNPELQTVAPGVQRLDVPVTAIAGIPGTSKLAIATPSTAGDLGNSIVAFNSSTRLVEH
jgi:hypothetical protein